MKKIFFVRHGQSELNAKGLASGSEIDTTLTNKGRSQAKKTGQELKNQEIELMVSSSMTRAYETAQIIAKEIGYNPKKIIKSPLFVERGFGIYTGQPDAVYMAAVTSNEPLHESVESTDDMHSRILEGLKWLESFDAERILLVGHGGVSRMLRLIHQELPHTHMYKLERLENAAIYEFDVE